MISTILGDGVILEFEPSSLLSQAHQAERAADRMVALHDFSGALDKYKKAEDLMENALKLSTNARVLESLQKQLEYLRKQPKVMERRKEDFARKQKLESIARKKELDWERTQLTETASQEETKEEEYLEDNQEPLILDETDNGTDSLLACLNENMFQESEGEACSYRMPVLRKFFAERSISRDSSSSEKSKTAVESESKEGDPREALIRRMERQNEELMEHISNLFQTLNSCEQENKALKVRLGLQEQELETLRSQSIRQWGNTELAFPFEDDYFGGGGSSPFSDPPSLPPLPQSVFLGDGDSEVKGVFEFDEE